MRPIHDIYMDGRLVARMKGRVYDPRQSGARSRLDPLPVEWPTVVVTTATAVIAGWLLGIVQASTWVRH